MKMANRPTGVTVICVLVFILSILETIGGVAYFGFRAIAGVASGAADFLGVVIYLCCPGPGLLGGADLYIFVTAAVGAIYLVAGLVGLVASYLLLKMKRTGWILVTIIGIISIIVNLLSITSGATINLSFILWIIVLIYLYTKRSLFS